MNVNNLNARFNYSYISRIIKINNVTTSTVFNALQTDSGKNRLVLIQCKFDLAKTTLF